MESELFKDMAVSYITHRLKSGQEAHTTLRGISMKPTIVGGQRIRIIPTPIQGLKTGDIIAYRLGESHYITVHRIIKVLQEERPCFQTKGDNNTYEDAYTVTEKMYIGHIKL